MNSLNLANAEDRLRVFESLTRRESLRPNTLPLARNYPHFGKIGGFYRTSTAHSPNHLEASEQAQWLIKECGFRL